VKRVAFCKARDAWKNWKYVLTKYFVRRGRDPFKKYKSITEDDWAKLKKTRKTKNFKELSKTQGFGTTPPQYGGGRILRNGSDLETT
jgi:hypothetical protein